LCQDKPEARSGPSRKPLGTIGRAGRFIRSFIRLFSAIGAKGALAKGSRVRDFRLRPAGMDRSL
jgi:hypothetical protein